MRDNNEIKLFGHTIPKKVYEDYKNLEKFKDKLNRMLRNSKEFTDDERAQLEKLFASMSEKLNEMDSQAESKLIETKRTPPSMRS